MAPRNAHWKQAVADFVESARNNPMGMQYLGGLVSPTHMRHYYTQQRGGRAIFGSDVPRQEQAAAMAREINEAPGLSVRAPEGYDTNLAAEFHVLSLLHRLGFTANLTLGNKKAVDILVVSRTGVPCTIDVKGLAGSTGWPIDNAREPAPRHFYAFVCYNDLMGDPWASPEVYVVPSGDLAGLKYKAPIGRRLMRGSTLRHAWHQYEQAWHLLDRAES